MAIDLQRISQQDQFNSALPFKSSISNVDDFEELSSRQLSAFFAKVLEQNEKLTRVSESYIATTSTEYFQEEILSGNETTTLAFHFEPCSIYNEIALIQDSYNVQNSPDIQSFLHTHQHLVPVLVDARFYLQKYFGSDTQISLELINYEENWSELFANIHTSLSVQQAQAQLDKLDDNWFLDQIDIVNGQFNLNLEFI